MNARTLPSTTFAILLLFSHGGSLFAKGKQTVMVYQAEVTVDGQERPNLGRSLTDTFSGALLESYHIEVIDHLSLNHTTGKTEGSIPPERDAISIGRKEAIQKVLVPRMIIENDHHVFTVKMLEVTSGKLVKVYRETAEGSNRSVAYALIQKVVTAVKSDIAREQQQLAHDSRKTDPRPTVIDPTSQPNPYLEEVVDPFPMNPTRSQVRPSAMPPKALPTDSTTTQDQAKPSQSDPRSPTQTPPVIDLSSGDPSKVEKPQVPEKARPFGRIDTVNTAWRFCVITVPTGIIPKIDEKLFVPVTDHQINAAQLKIVRIEGRKVVADFSRDMEAELVTPGSTVYYAE